MKINKNLNILQKAIKEGIESGISENFNAKKNLELLNANKRILEISPK